MPTSHHPMQVSILSSTLPLTLLHNDPRLDQGGSNSLIRLYTSSVEIQAMLPSTNQNPHHPFPSNSQSTFSVYAFCSHAQRLLYTTIHHRPHGIPLTPPSNP
ncbi:hypothetical protein V8C34DRAFT_286414 [Trichoderma compactum]